MKKPLSTIGVVLGIAAVSLAFICIDIKTGFLALLLFLSTVCLVGSTYFDD